MRLTEFMEAAKAEAKKHGIEDITSVAVYAFCEFDNTYYVCQIAIDKDVLRAPIMHSPEAAIAAFGDSLRHYEENGSKKENSDIEI